MTTPDITFKPLWRLLIDRDLSKRDLQKQAEISRSTLWKMGRDEYVSLDVITKICKTLDCNVDQIMEII